MSLPWLAALLLAGAVRADYFTDTGITPSVVPTSPTSWLTFQYGATTVRTGRRYAALTTLAAPQVSFHAASDKQYTLLFFNLDATVDRTACNLLASEPTEYLLWQVVNIPGAAVGSGLTATAYAAPLNEAGTAGTVLPALASNNRCVAVVAEQTKSIQPNVTSAVIRDCFNFKTVAAAYGLRLDNYAGLAFNTTGQL